MSMYRQKAIPRASCNTHAHLEDTEKQAESTPPAQLPLPRLQGAAGRPEQTASFCRTHSSSLRKSIQVRLTPRQKAASSSMETCGRFCRYGRSFSGTLEAGTRRGRQQARQEKNLKVDSFSRASPAFAEGESAYERPQAAVEAHGGRHAEDDDDPDGCGVGETGRDRLLFRQPQHSRPE